jgi:hypothetical protein
VSADIDAWLEEGLKHYALSDPARALQAWFKVLDAEPQNARALEYISHVRKNYRVDVQHPALGPIEGAPQSNSSNAPAQNTSGAAAVDGPATTPDDPVPMPPAASTGTSGEWEVNEPAADHHEAVVDLADEVVEGAPAQPDAQPEAETPPVAEAPSEPEPEPPVVMGAEAAPSWGDIVQASLDDQAPIEEPVADEEVPSAPAEPVEAAEPAADEDVPAPPAEPVEAAEPAADEDVPAPPAEPVEAAEPAADEDVPTPPVEPVEAAEPAADPVADEDVPTPPVEPVEAAEPAADPVADEDVPTPPAEPVEAAEFAVDPVADEDVPAPPAEPVEASEPAADPVAAEDVPAPPAEPVEAAEPAAEPAADEDVPAPPADAEGAAVDGSEAPVKAADVSAEPEGEPAADDTVQVSAEASEAASADTAPTTSEASGAPELAAPAAPVRAGPSLDGWAAAIDGPDVDVDTLLPQAAASVATEQDASPVVELPPPEPEREPAAAAAEPELAAEVAEPDSAPALEPEYPSAAESPDGSLLPPPSAAVPAPSEDSATLGAMAMPAPSADDEDGDTLESDVSDGPFGAPSSDESTQESLAAPPNTPVEEEEGFVGLVGSAAGRSGPGSAEGAAIEVPEESGPQRRPMTFDPPAAAAASTTAVEVRVTAPIVASRYNTYESVDDRAPVAATASAEPAAATEPAPPAASSTSDERADADGSSPWDEWAGESDAIDLDQNRAASNVFDKILSQDGQPPVAPETEQLAPAALMPSADDAELMAAANRLRAADEAAAAIAAAAAGLPAADPTPPPAAEPAPAASAAPAEPAPAAEPEQEEDECEALMSGARELFALGDFSGSLELVEKVLEIDPQNEEARGYLKRNEGTLLQMYESKLGDLEGRPRQITPPDEVIWMNLHHRAGFLLAQVDGLLSYEDLAAVSGMSRLETFRILAELKNQGVITT